jgi:hypothetical protein
MSTLLRLSAASASVILVSAALGFELGAAMVPANANDLTEISSGPRVVSPGSSRENVATRSIAVLRGFSFASRSISSRNVPAMNLAGPEASNVHANLGRTRAIASACLMAMN